MLPGLYLEFWVTSKSLDRVPGNLLRLIQRKESGNPHLLRVSRVIGIGKEATSHLSICSYTCPQGVATLETRQMNQHYYENYMTRTLLTIRL